MHQVDVEIFHRHSGNFDLQVDKLELEYPPMKFSGNPSHSYYGIFDKCQLSSGTYREVSGSSPLTDQHCHPKSH